MQMSLSVCIFMNSICSQKSVLRGFLEFILLLKGLNKFETPFTSVKKKKNYVDVMMCILQWVTVTPASLRLRQLKWSFLIPTPGFSMIILSSTQNA